MTLPQSGNYKMQDSDSVRFQLDDAEGAQNLAMDIANVHGQLWLVDPAQAVTYVLPPFVNSASAGNSELGFDASTAAKDSILAISHFLT